MAPRPDETDLIPDGEITSSELDAFQHGHFVDRLLATIKDTTTPSRIALFASWGSGKTSIARLLEPLVKKLGYEFAHFDAFKYAREPLLREFIISLAHETKGEPEAEKLRSQLYEAQSNIRFRADLDRRLGEIAKAFGLLGQRLSSRLVVMALIAAFIVAVLVDREIVQIAALASVGLAIVFALLAIAQATGMLSIVGDSLRLTVSRERPDSPEQFEMVARTFIQRNLKVTGDEKKLVVFVDELDRVDASEVIGTLETLKTFLDLPGCVFVVGADRRVIEKAIAHRARQETPVVVTDPYYSSASSYLDKIFQHQLELPDVMPDRLSRFARDLALKHGGVWRELREHGPGTLDDVVSVLVPIHVSNPRRVKILMNAYVHAYHLSQARHEIDYLGAPAIDRATEIAKLVVLRAEFPGFAEELLNDPDLTQDIPVWREQWGAVNDQESSNGQEVADGYAVEEDESGAGDERETENEIDERRAREIEAALNRPLSVVISRGEEEKDLHELIAPARERLCRYLEQTRVIEGPAEDLLRLESMGSPFGLNDRTASSLRDAAYGNAPEAAHEIIENLEGESARLGAIRLLAMLLRRGIGIDADNALVVLLGVAQSAVLSLEQVAHEIAPAIRGHIGHRGISDPEYLGGVLRIGVSAEDDDLVARALNHDHALGSASLRRIALSLADSLIANHANDLARILAVEQMADPGVAAQGIADLGIERAEVLLLDASGLAARVLEGQIIDDVEAALDEVDDADRLANVGEFIERLAPGALTECALMALAKAGHSDAQAVLSQELDGRDSIEHPDLAVSVLRTSAERSYVELGQRLPVLAASDISIDARARYVPPIVLAHWRGMDQSPESPEDTGTVQEALLTLTRGLELSYSDDELVEFMDPLSAQPGDEAGVAELQRRHEIALRMADLGVPIGETVFDNPLRALLNAVGTPAPAVSAELADPVYRFAINLISGASSETVRSVLDQGNHLPLARYQDVGFRLRAVEELLARGEDSIVPVSRDDVHVAAQEVDDDYLETLWIGNFEDDVTEVGAFVNPWREGTLSDRLQGAIERFRERTTVTTDQLIRAVLEELEEWPSVDFLRGLGAPEVTNGPLIELVNDFGGERTAAMGGRGLDVWEAASPTSPDDRKALILGFLLPLAEESGAAFDVAIERCAALCADPPHGTKEAIKSRLLGAANQGRDSERKRRGKRAANVLIGLGLMQEPRKGVGNWVRKRLGLD